jgi:ferric-dicitrate binding protein FerR (iron transport regulator)
MALFEQSDTFLAKWMANDITEKELEAFKVTEDYALFSRIAIESEGFSRAHIDKDEVYNSILQDIAIQKNVKVRPLFPSWIGAVAASLALLISTLYFIPKDTTATSDFGEQLTITLPDDSEVILNSRSKLSYNKKKWSKNRMLTLEGEAYFKVTKGSTFTVETSEGHIAVLGTQFSVLQDKDFLLVKCFEGRVKVESHGNTVFLTRGKTYKYVKGNTTDEATSFDETEPSWTKGESIFRSVPLKVVFKSLEKQYNITIKNNVIDGSRSFTGSFVHSNISQALEAVLLPMNLDYTFSDDKKEVILIKPLGE